MTRGRQRKLKRITAKTCGKMTWRAMPLASALLTCMHPAHAADTGETAYAPATFTDPLAGVADDATYAADAQAHHHPVGIDRVDREGNGTLGDGDVTQVILADAAIVLFHALRVVD